MQTYGSAISATTAPITVQEVQSREKFWQRIRAKVIEHYTFPSFLSKVLQRPAGILLYFGIPIILVALYLAIFNPKIPEGEIVLGRFIPHLHVELAGFAVGAWVLFVAALSAYRFWVAINSEISKVYEYEVKEGGEIRTLRASARFWNTSSGR